ncbi:MAG: hypothetical protein CML87_02850 [Rhodobiaceae bacterium]|jgi:YggT family protein|nr:hypothetical protein [Rhodobiaceae bacterium]|tara:strand:+ start:3632 stop:3919 length:288 start_codon:yes stop_codon:yes gene_type:complete
MNSVYFLLDTILDLYSWLVIIAVILSWLVSFGVVNRSNQLVRMFYEASWRLTEPAFNYVRRYLPNLGGLDISPVIILLVIFFLRSFLREYWPINF